MKSILVIGIGENEKRKAKFENSFAYHLQEQGVVGITSKDVGLPLEITREMVEKVVAERDIDGVVVTRLVGFDIKSSMQHGTPTGVGGNNLYAVAGNSNVLIATTWTSELNLRQFTLQLETRLFDSKTGKKIWQVSSDSVEQDSLGEMIESFSQVFAKEMSQKGFLAQ